MANAWEPNSARAVMPAAAAIERVLDEYDIIPAPAPMHEAVPCV